MYCNAIAQSYNSEDEILELPDSPPESDPIIRLDLNADRTLYYSSTPFFLQIRPFAENLVLEIVRELVVRHAFNYEGLCCSLPR